MAKATMAASRTPWQEYADDYDRIRDTNTFRIRALHTALAAVWQTAPADR